MGRNIFHKFLLLFFLVLIAWIGGIVFLLRPFLAPGILLGSNLVILTNEFEARPCGGFITAFGEVQLFPPKVFLKNSYHFEKATLGANISPLDQVASDMKFWDLAVDTDLEACTSRIEAAYESLEFKEIDHTILLSFGTIERIFALVEPIRFEGETYTKNNLFAELSRSVSDVDRHDEESLQKRKSPLSRFGKAMMLKLILKPWAMMEAAQVIREEMARGEIFVSGISNPITPTKKDIVVREWNLGGAKSSRYLQKELKIKIREEIAEKWNAEIVLNVEHLGQFDEPLSIDWKGIIEVQFPDFLDGGIASFSLELKPGESFSESFTFSDIQIPVNEKELYEIGVFRSRGQELLLDLSVSAYPQQYLQGGNLSIRDNVGTYYGPLHNVATSFEWYLEADGRAPFVTLHEVVQPENFASFELAQRFVNYDIVGEIHFNESVYDGSDVKISLQDKNHGDLVHNDPQFGDYVLLEDRRTMIIGFNQSIPQANERYYLHLKGLRDGYGNEIQSGPWTLIPR